MRNSPPAFAAASRVTLDPIDSTTIRAPATRAPPRVLHLSPKRTVRILGVHERRTRNEHQQQRY